MAMNLFSLCKNQMTKTICLLALSVLLASAADATELPPGVLRHLRQMDHQVKVRFDGLVLFSNGESYVPIIPQDASGNGDVEKVISNIPPNVQYPDVIQFDNDFFLLRLIQTSSGRLTFPKMQEYPIQMKEGLLPQDFVLPNNLYIPVELKVILGSLPYNPQYTPTDKTTSTSQALQESQTPMPLHHALRLAYVFDLTQQKILSIDPVTGQKKAEVSIDSMPSSLRLSPDSKLLFAPSLASNELVVIDTGSNLVKTRIPVGQRPEATLYLEAAQTIVVSNRFSQFLSLINTHDLVSGKKIELPGTGGAMAQIPHADTPQIVLADAFKPQIYLVDLSSRLVSKTLPAPPDISAVHVFQASTVRTAPDKLEPGKPEIWVLSRTENKAYVLDTTGTILKTLDVGKKPIGMAAYDKKLFILSAGDARVDVIDCEKKTLLGSINIPAESFPSSIVSLPSEKRAYITTAAANSLVTINLDTFEIEENIPVEFRASLMAISPDRESSSQKPSSANNLPQALPAQQANLEESNSQKVFKNKNIQHDTLNKPVSAELSQPSTLKKSTQATAPQTLSTTENLSDSTSKPVQANSETFKSEVLKNDPPKTDQLPPVWTQIWQAEHLNRQPQQPAALHNAPVNTISPAGINPKVIPATAPPVAAPSSALKNETLAPAESKLPDKTAPQADEVNAKDEKSPSVPQALPNKPGVQKTRKPLSIPQDLPNEGAVAPKMQSEPSVKKK